jgi:genome maintenance exonuclease 1
VFNHTPISFPKLECVTLPSGIRHYETPDGKRYPSVTTVLGSGNKTHLNEWRVRVGEEEAAKITRRAGVRGTRMHSLAEKYLNNECVVPIMYDKPMFDSMVPYLNRINNIRAQEIGLFSHHLRLAGTCDCVGDFDGRLSIIDFKTSLRPKKREWISNYFMQAAGYAVMFEERTGIPINRTVVIIGVDGDDTQLFIERRNSWIPGLLEMRDNFESQHLTDEVK